MPNHIPLFIGQMTAQLHRAGEISSTLEMNVPQASGPTAASERNRAMKAKRRCDVNKGFPAVLSKFMKAFGRSGG